MNEENKRGEKLFNAIEGQKNDNIFRDRDATEDAHFIAMEFLGFEGDPQILKQYFEAFRVAA